MPVVTHPLVFIPGLLCDHRLWASQIAPRPVEMTVADITAQPTLSGMAAAVLEKASAHFSLAGFSLGSQVALEIMRIAPARVERLALLSATHGGLPPSVEVAVRQAITTIQQGRLDQYLEAAYPSYVAATRVQDRALKRTFFEMAHAIGPDAGVRQMRALLSIPGPFTNLDQIRCPTLVIGGREDRRTTPSAHEALAREIPGSELAFVEDAAHFTPLEQPGVVTALFQRWLAL